jgi:hypothetical protein
MSPPKVRNINNRATELATLHSPPRRACPARREVGVGFTPFSSLKVVVKLCSKALNIWAKALYVCCFINPTPKGVGNSLAPPEQI